MPDTFDLTPTWATTMAIIIAVLESGTDNGKTAARNELMELAKRLDSMNMNAKEE